MRHAMRTLLTRSTQEAGFNFFLEMIPGKDSTASVNTCTLNQPIVSNPPAQPFHIDFNNPQDYKTQIWPLEEQKREQLQLASQYDDLCRLLQQKLNMPKDHNSRAEQIKDRLRRKLEAKKNNQSQIKTSS